MALPEFRVTGRAWVAGALWLLLMPVQWVGAVIFAAAVHELGHLAALWAWGIAVRRLEIDAFGARIEAGEMEPGEELICALAGPAAGLVLCLFWHWIPRIGLIALMQSVFNLLPVYPLDGGRALKAAVNLVRNGPRKEKSVANKRCSGYNKRD